VQITAISTVFTPGSSKSTISKDQHRSSGKWTSAGHLTGKKSVRSERRLRRLRLGRGSCPPRFGRAVKLSDRSRTTARYPRFPILQCHIRRIPECRLLLRQSTVQTHSGFQSTNWSICRPPGGKCRHLIGNIDRSFGHTPQRRVNCPSAPRRLRHRSGALRRSQTRKAPTNRRRA